MRWPLSIDPLTIPFLIAVQRSIIVFEGVRSVSTDVYGHDFELDNVLAKKYPYPLVNGLLTSAHGPTSRCTKSKML